MRLWIEKKELPLKVNWKLSRNQTSLKENFIVHLETDMGKFYSEIAPNTRYGETLDSIQYQFNNWVGFSDLSVESLDEVKLHHSLRFGLESVLLSFEAKKKKMTLSEFLGLPSPVRVPTSYSMPIMPIGEIKNYLMPISRFQSLKIKVDAESAQEMLQEIDKHTDVKLRIDANEGWKDLNQFMHFQESLGKMNIELIEQPFPSSMVADYKELKKHTPYKILADESIEDVGDFSELSKQFHAVNIKLMKTGSLIKARDLMLEARKNNLETMIGCMIETTIGISYGMLFGAMANFVDLDGFLLIKDEPFHLVNEAEGFLNLV